MKSTLKSALGKLIESNVEIRFELQINFRTSLSMSNQKYNTKVGDRIHMRELSLSCKLISSNGDVCLALFWLLFKSSDRVRPSNALPLPLLLLLSDFWKSTWSKSIWPISKRAACIRCSMICNCAKLNFWPLCEELTFIEPFLVGKFNIKKKTSN